MIININEYNAVFSIDMTPQNKEDAVTLARLGLNHKKTPANIWVDVHRDKTMRCSISIPKRTKDITTIK